MAAGGDGISVTGNGLQEAMEHALAMGKRLGDLSRPLKVIGAEIVRRTDDAFQNSRSPQGEEFAQLAPSTLRRRIGALKGANRRNKKGQLTKSSLKMRARLSAPGGTKPMVNTGRARASQHVDVTASLLTWSAVGYLAPSITGGQRGGKTGQPPKRNVSVFEHGGGGLSLSIFGNTSAGWRMGVSMADYARNVIANYVRTGKPAVSA